VARILVVDDESTIAAILEQTLTRAGYDVLVARDGLDAMQKLLMGSIDLVVTDIIMPNMNGLEMIKEMQKKYPKVKIIAISGGGPKGGPTDYLEVAKDLGAARCLFKPFMLNELTALVKDLLAE
jgi:DNA-binding response OmpR family regulator